MQVDVGIAMVSVGHVELDAGQTIDSRHPGHARRLRIHCTWSSAYRKTAVATSAPCSDFGVRGYAFGSCFNLSTRPTTASILRTMRLDVITGWRRFFSALTSCLGPLRPVIVAPALLCLLDLVGLYAQVVVILPLQLRQGIIS